MRERVAATQQPGHGSDSRRRANSFPQKSSLRTPLEYAVSLNISPSEEFCFIQNLPLVRAILSWNFPPPANSPNWIPVWGDVKDATIQIEGFEFIIFANLLAEAKVKLPNEFAQAVNLNQPIHVSEAKALGPVDLHELYKGKNVPQHRYLASSLSAAVGPTASTAKAALSYAVAAKAVPSFAGIPDINLAALVEAWLNTQGNTAFEQLDCVGLDVNASPMTVETIAAATRAPVRVRKLCMMEYLRTRLYPSRSAPIVKDL